MDKIVDEIILKNANPFKYGLFISIGYFLANTNIYINYNRLCAIYRPVVKSLPFCAYITLPLRDRCE